MARRLAQFNVAIWNDDDYRALPAMAQWLYEVLWTHPGLSYCGVIDWRPGKIAARAADLDAATVQLLGDCLEAHHFIVRDADTEECLIRSWVRWDGLLNQPRLAVSYTNAYADVASARLRGVIVHEAQKLREREPGLVGWKNPAVLALVAKAGVDPKVGDQVTDPFRDGFGYRFGPGLGVGLAQTLPNVSVPVSVPPTPAPAPAPAPQGQEIRASDVSDADERARPEVDELCELLADLIEQNGNKRPISATKVWRDPMRRAIDIDRRTPAELAAAIRWSQQNDFWARNIMSPTKLREKYDRLRSDAIAEKAKRERDAQPPRTIKQQAQEATVSRIMNRAAERDQEANEQRRVIEQ